LEEDWQLVPVLFCFFWGTTGHYFAEKTGFHVEGELSSVISMISPEKVAMQGE
jgi:hypothetical protein